MNWRNHSRDMTDNIFYRENILEKHSSKYFPKFSSEIGPGKKHDY